MLVEMESRANIPLWAVGTPQPAGTGGTAAGAAAVVLLRGPPRGSSRAGTPPACSGITELGRALRTPGPLPGQAMLGAAPTPWRERDELHTPRSLPYPAGVGVPPVPRSWGPRDRAGREKLPLGTHRLQQTPRKEVINVHLFIYTLTVARTAELT